MFTLDNQFVLDIGGVDNNNSPYKENKDNEFKSINLIEKELSSLDFKKKIIVQGGEPSIHLDFPKIIRLCLEKKPKKLIIITNARIFSQEGIVENLFFDENIEIGRASCRERV